MDKTTVINKINELLGEDITEQFNFMFEQAQKDLKEYFFIHNYKADMVQVIIYLDLEDLEYTYRIRRVIP